MTALGAPRLAELLLAAGKTDPALRRALTLEIAPTPDALAEEIARQVQRLRTERTRVNAARAVRIGREAVRLIETTVGRLGRDDPAAAFDRLLDLLDAGGAILDRRTGEGRPLPEVFARIGPHAAELAARLDGPAQVARIDLLLRAFLGDGHGVAPDLVARVGAALTPDARVALRRRLETDLADPAVDAAPRLAALGQLADAEGDVDAWMLTQARLPPRRRDHTGGARRLLAAERPEDALATLDAAPAEALEPQSGSVLRIAALEALGRLEEAQTARWRLFEADLSTSALRAFLKRLADFEDVEREAEALDWVLELGDPLAALDFLMSWPDPRRAAALARARIEPRHGKADEVLTPAAEALAQRDPLAATILFRAMIDFTLASGQTARFSHAASHFHACTTLATSISDWEDRVDHAAYAERLAGRYDHLSKFWFRVLI